MNSLGRPSVARVLLDLSLITLLSFTAEMTHFSAQQGRAVLCGDSVQYVEAAEALLRDDVTPRFEMRKPLYSFLLAGIALIFGNMGWAAVVANHLLLALLPLVAYGLGLQLRSRGVAWVSAIFTVVQLQYVVWGNRMMSECLYVFVLSIGVLVFCVGVNRKRPLRWMLPAGGLIGIAWLTRVSANVILPAVVLVLLWQFRRDLGRAATNCGAFLIPVACAFALECGLNLNLSGQFRPANGAAGAALLLRMRHDQGAELPPGPDTEVILSWLPERSREDAYIAHHVDTWIARYHAIHDRGMNGWEFDELMGRVGMAAMMREPIGYLLHSVRMGVHHLMRRSNALALLPVP